MKIFTIKDFKDFEKNNGTTICPTGDYSNIKVFGNNCKFGDNSKFGERCKFGDNCKFGERCSFGEWNSFGKNCNFGESCSFGSNCSFREWNSFKESCKFGERNSFRRNCKFGGNSKFGEWCNFKEYCEFENNGVAKTTTPFITMSGGSANRTSYAFNLENGIFVRSGCFFGTLKQFEDAVIRTHGGNSIHGKTYLTWIEIIKISF